MYFEKLAGIAVPPRRAGALPGAIAHRPDPVLLGQHRPRPGLVLPLGRCGARGAIYDLASVLLGGPWGRELRGEEFKRARAYVADVFGEIT